MGELERHQQQQREPLGDMKRACFVHRKERCFVHEDARGRRAASARHGQWMQKSYSMEGLWCPDCDQSGEKKKGSEAERNRRTKLTMLRAVIRRGIANDELRAELRAECAGEKQNNEHLLCAMSRC